MTESILRRQVGAVAIEALESRTLLAVSEDADGWTVVTPGDDTRIIYVSSSEGDDDNDGRTSKRSVESLARGISLLRNGQPDWLLLRAGDLFDEAFPKWNLSGQSEQSPILISSFGPGERPLIRTGAGGAFRTGGATIKHLAIVGIHFYAHTRDPYGSDYEGADGADGMVFLGDVHDLLIEDVVVDEYKKNIVFEPYYGRMSDVTIRRSVISDAYNGSGAYVAGVDSILIEENVFDHNGWNERVPQGDLPGHNLYMQPNLSDVVVRGNFFADAGSHGLQARSGGSIRDNLFLRNPIGMSFGLVNGATTFAGGVSGDVTGNVFLGSRDLKGETRGWGLEVGNTRPGANTTVRDNIFAHDTQLAFAAIQLDFGRGVSNPEDSPGLNDVTIERNIVYRWHKGLSTTSSFEPGSQGYKSFDDVTVRDNDFQQTISREVIDHGKPVRDDLETWSRNRYSHDGDDPYFSSGVTRLSWSEWHDDVDRSGDLDEVSYPAPQRDVETYNAGMGGKPKVGAFMTQARLQSRRYWRGEFAPSSVVAYVREGFGRASAPPRIVSTNLANADLGPVRRQISFQFSRDVSDSVSESDLTIWNRETFKIVRAAETELSYARATNTATWTFGGLDRGLLPSGKWELSLSAPGITDAGLPLDADGDGIAGDSYALKFTLLPRV